MNLSNLVIPRSAAPRNLLSAPLVRKKQIPRSASKWQRVGCFHSDEAGQQQSLSNLVIPNRSACEGRNLLVRQGSRKKPEAFGWRSRFSAAIKALVFNPRFSALSSVTTAKEKAGRVFNPPGGTQSIS
jgi:hypothetical protein